MIYDNPNYHKLEQAFANQKASKEKQQVLFFKVDSNPNGAGKPQEIGFVLDSRGNITSNIFTQYNIDNVDYAYSNSWKDRYTGDFVLVETIIPNIKPTLYKVGDLVKINSEVEKIGCYSDWYKVYQKEFYIGRILEIKEITDNDYNISYCFFNTDIDSLPHYCLDLLEDETIKIGENTYSKIEFENAVKNLKTIK